MHHLISELASVEHSLDMIKINKVRPKIKKSSKGEIQRFLRGLLF